MSTVKACLAQKSPQIHSLGSSVKVVRALQTMRDNRVRSVLVIDDDQLKGIVTQGDCAIKVLLPGLDANTVTIGEIMTRDPMTVSQQALLDQCMKIMMARSIRHLPVLEGGRVVGMVSIGDIVKNIIQQQGDHIRHLETYIKGHAVEY
jgi:CBS domain-containing protein